MKKNALGRGLDALLPEDSYRGNVRQIPVTELDLNPDQPRKAFDEAALEQLADSIREVGLLQPILVKPEQGRYRIIAGERRFRAARLAGLNQIPCIEKEFSQHEMLLAALIENLQREDLNPMEEAEAIRAIMDRLSLTQEEAAKRLGKSRPALANTLRLLSLPPEVAALVREGKLSEGHARALAGLKSQSRQVALALLAVRDGLSVRALEALCKQPEKPRLRQTPTRLAPELQDFVERLQRITGMRTQIKGDMQRGTITLRYASYEEIEAFYEAMREPE